MTNLERCAVVTICLYTIVLQNGGGANFSFTSLFHEAERLIQLLSYLGPGRACRDVSGTCPGRVERSPDTSGAMKKKKEKNRGVS